MTCSALIHSHRNSKGMQKWAWFLSLSNSLGYLGHILDSTRLSGRVFVEADITKYGPLDEIKFLYQEAWWSLPSETNLLFLLYAVEASEKLPRWAFFRFSFFSLLYYQPAQNAYCSFPIFTVLFSPPTYLFSSHLTSSLREWKCISTGYTVCSFKPQPGYNIQYLCSIIFSKCTTTNVVPLSVSFLAPFLSCVSLLLGSLKWC